MAKDIGCPLFVIDQYPMSELQRWRNLYMVEFYNNNPDKLKFSPDDISIEESQQRLMELFRQSERR